MKFEEYLIIETEEEYEDILKKYKWKSTVTKSKSRVKGVSHSSVDWTKKDLRIKFGLKGNWVIFRDMDVVERGDNPSDLEKFLKK